ncbi:protein LNK4-like [Malania oleifera]|uniref:protein LNK4-like n=1 Tax=Malania oleifera TaxID=397392 RepID=UPI0025ADF7B2|nr:protein LNK4-like [Malania oleifera]
MDLYFGTGVNDFLVPRDSELFDRLPSPEDWLRWGGTESESFGSMNNMTVDEPSCKGRNLCNDVDAEIPGTKVENYSVPSRPGTLSEGSLQQNTFSHDLLEYQLNDLAEIDHVDDIFLSSFLDEGLPAMENLHGSFGFSPGYQYSPTATDDPSINTVSDSQSVSSNLYGLGGSKYLKADDFSISLGKEKEECSPSHSTPCKLGQKKGCSKLEAPMIKIPVPTTQNGEMGEETSLEESVLLELEGAMAKLTQKTRICFRDALYRLAKNSEEKQTVTQSQSGEFTVEKSLPPVDETSRSGAQRPMESVTNTIDRAIANLMFDNVDANAQNLDPAALVNFEGESIDPASVRSNGKVPNPMLGRANPRRTRNVLGDFQVWVQ